MDKTEERNERLSELSQELDAVKRDRKARQLEVEEAETQVREARQKLDSSRQAVADMHAEETSFDPKTNDADLERLTKETVKGHRIAGELKEAEGVLSEARKKLEDVDAKQQDVLGRIRGVFVQYGWEQDED